MNIIETWIDSFYKFLGSLGYTHPVHPALVHIPIGLVIGAWVLGLSALISKQASLARSSRHCLILAFIFFFPTVLFGFADWQHFYGGTLLFLIKMKLILAGILVVLLLVGVMLSLGAKSEYVSLSIICTLCFMVVVGLGYFGGELVYGLKSSPPSSQYLTGEKIFQAHCSACHPNGGNTMAPSKPLIDSPKLSDLDTFTAWIRHPDAPMPAFAAAAISDQQVEELYQYAVNVLNQGAGEHDQATKSEH